MIIKQQDNIDLEIPNKLGQYSKLIIFKIIFFMFNLVFISKSMTIYINLFW
jgi:hypothetical protein